MKDLKILISLKAKEGRSQTVRLLYDLILSFARQSFSLIGFSLIGFYACKELLVILDLNRPIYIGLHYNTV